MYAPVAPTKPVVGVLIAGVGGQGVLLLSELVALAAIEAGFDAKQTEIHGVSQRGGSVHSHVRFGQQVQSPLISRAQAAVVVAMERLEAMRFASYAAPDGQLIMNAYESLPISAGPAGAALYPHDAVQRLAAAGRRVTEIAATELARDQLGNERVANVVMLGLLAAALPITYDVWHAALAQRLPAHFLDLNRSAFDLGFGLAAGLQRRH